jgi:hypothetical protein
LSGILAGEIDDLRADFLAVAGLAGDSSIGIASKLASYNSQKYGSGENEL